MYFVANICMLVCCNGASTSNIRKATFYSVLEKNRENGLSLAHVALSDEKVILTVFFDFVDPGHKVLYD